MLRLHTEKVLLGASLSADLFVIGAGDVKQLPSIEPDINCQNVGGHAEEDVDTWFDIICTCNIFFKTCKRVGKN